MQPFSKNSQAFLILSMLLWSGCGSDPPRPPPLQEEMVRSLRQGEQLYRKGRWHKALAEYQQALILAQVRLDRASEAATLISLGHIKFALHQTALGLDDYRQALIIANELEDSQLANRARLGVAEIHRHLLELSQAEEFYSAVLVATFDKKDEFHQSLRIQALNGQALVLKEGGKIPAGMLLLNEAELLIGPDTDLRLQAATFLNRSTLTLASKQTDAADQLVKQAMKIYQSLEDLPGIAACSVQLSRIAQLQGKQREAVSFLTRAKQINQFLEQ